MKNKEWWREFFDKDYFEQYEKSLTPKRTKKEAGCIEKILKLRKTDKILDLACGQGRISLELAKRGYQVTGLDYSRFLLGVARKRAKQAKLKINFIPGDMRRISFKEEFDVIILWFTAFGYFSDRDNSLVVKKIYQALKKGGRFLIEVVNREGIPLGPTKTWEDHKSFVVLESHEYDKKSKRDNCQRIFIRRNRRSEYNFSLKLYSFPEIKKILEKERFKVSRVYGNRNLAKFTRRSPRIIAVAKK